MATTLNPIFQDIFAAHSMISTIESPLDPPEDKNADRLAAIRDRIDDLQNEIEELERQYEYIASGDEVEDLRAEAMERWGAG